MKQKLRWTILALLSLTVVDAHALDPASTELSGLKIGMTRDQALAAFSTSGFKFLSQFGKDPQGPDEMTWRGPNNETVKAQFGGIPRKLYRVERDAPRVKIGNEFQNLYEPQSICDSMVKKYGRPTEDIPADDKSGFHCVVSWEFIGNSFSTSSKNGSDCRDETIFETSHRNKCTFKLRGHATKQLWNLYMFSPYHYGIYRQETQDAKDKQRQTNQQLVPKAKTPNF